MTVPTTPGAAAPASPLDDRQRTRAVCEHLVGLLSRPGRYRRVWEGYARHRHHGPINQAAVTRTLADYLVEGRIRTAATKTVPRGLKDRVARVCNGQVLSRETLTWFIEAFGISEEDSETLWAMLQGIRPGVRVRGDWRPARLLAPPRNFETVAIHEFHHLDRRGWPVTHRTVQVIRALVDDVGFYPHRFDTHLVTVEVLRGGRAGPVVEEGGGLYRSEIVLDRPLKRGQTASLEYRSTFNYEAAPPPEFRRAIVHGVGNLEMWVQFDRRRLPRSIWWARWADLDGPVVWEEPAELDGQRAVHRYLEGAEKTIVGFRWEW